MGWRVRLEREANFNRNWRLDLSGPTLEAGQFLDELVRRNTVT